MPRPQRCRRVCTEPEYEAFSPEGISTGCAVQLSTDEYEVIRLVDYERLTHEQCAARMDISRTTVTEIYESARFKLADSLTNGKRLEIGGGKYRLCDGAGAAGCNKVCIRSANHNDYPDVRQMKGEKTMRIAVTYENGEVFQHFGHSAQFKLYDVEDGKIVSERVLDTNGSGHSALAELLSKSSVDALICGGIGGGAQTALAQAGIKLYGGVSGSADAAAQALAEDRLVYQPDIRCSHHDHEHGEGEHHCGEHGCGEHSCH